MRVNETVQMIAGSVFAGILLWALAILFLLF
jgi:hypothetical protein